MAITITTESLGSGDIQIIKFAGAATGDSSAPFDFTQWGDVCVQVLGTFGGASLAVEGSNDGGTTWATLNNAQGTAATFSAAAIKQIVERPRSIRVSVTGGAGVNLTAVFCLRRAQQLRV